MEKLAELAKLVEDLHTNLKRAKDQMESTETTAENSYVSRTFFLSLRNIQWVWNLTIIVY